jgi:hypothetical protein
MNPKPLISPAKRHALLAVIVLVFLATIAWNARFPVAGTAQETRTPLPTQPAVVATQPAGPATPTPNRFPEYATNKDMTNGVVLASTVLVLIVLIGTLTVIRHSNRSQR